MVTIIDIARLAGVAKSTVSRYLNGGAVSEETRHKIERVIKETGYVPNTFAQSLKAKRTGMIGTIVPRLNSYAASRTMMGIDDQLKEAEYQMLIANTNQNIEREIDNIYSFARQKAAGIILLATEITPAHLEAVRSVNIPFLIVGQQHEQLYSVTHDDESSAYDLGKMVLSKGHRKIAYLGVTERDVAVGLKRKQGFARAVEQAGDCEVRYYETSFAIADARELALQIMQSSDCPDVFVCATDNIALGVLKSAYQLGRSVPEHFSITGFGGYDVTEIVHPGITTVQYDYQAAGMLAARNIVHLINGEPIPKISISGYQIIERESLASFQ